MSPKAYPDPFAHEPPLPWAYRQGLITHLQLVGCYMSVAGWMFVPGRDLDTSRQLQVVVVDSPDISGIALRRSTRNGVEVIRWIKPPPHEDHPWPETHWLCAIAGAACIDLRCLRPLLPATDAPML